MASPRRTFTPDHSTSSIRGRATLSSITRRCIDLINVHSDASFTEATRTLLGFKLPPALLAGDMAMFSSVYLTVAHTLTLCSTRRLIHSFIHVM